MDKAASAARSADCALGLENHLKIVEVDRRVTVLEKCKSQLVSDSDKSGSMTSALQVAMIMLSIAGAVYGSVAWLEREITMQSTRHDRDLADVKETLMIMIESASTLRAEDTKAQAALRKTEKERTDARLSKLEAHHEEDAQRMYEQREALQTRIDELIRDQPQKGQ